ncbi:MAG: TonB family protein, partial [Gemmatimonadetes bacterium]|nr:TonB family protein [Gemmatimonadota bacterium]
ATESRIEVRVGPGGQVLDARLAQSSGSRVLDDMAMRSAREARFLPELVDGIPVEAVYISRSRQSR